MSSMCTALFALRATGRQHLSASKSVARQATGSHVYQIDTYEKIRRMMAKGDKMRSGTFTVGGHDWRVECYPNGYPGHDGSLSLFLNHASHDRTGDARRPHSCRGCFSRTTYLSWGLNDFIKHKDLDKETYLKDDCLTVVCDVTVTGLCTDDHTVAEVAEPEPTLVEPPFDLHGPIGEVIWNKQKPDVNIEAGGKTFAVHRWVLQARSPVFKEDLSLASAAGEGAAELRIDDMDAGVCRALLQFIYTDRLDLYLVRFINNEIPGTDLLKTAAMAERLLIAADRYKLERLKQICVMALLPTIRMSSVAATLALAERHRCPDLKNACIQFLSSPGNFKALVETDGFEKMKTECPSALLNLLVKHMVKQTQ